MKVVVRHIILMILLLGLAGGAAMVYSRAWDAFLHRKSAEPVIRLHPAGTRLVTAADIKKVMSRVPDTATDPIARIRRMERELSDLPLVERAEVWQSPSGQWFVDIYQIKPLAYVNTFGTRRFMDIHGQLLPISPHEHPVLPVITGNFTDRQTAGIYPLIKYLYAHPQWYARVRNIYFDGKNIRFGLRRIATKVFFGDTTGYRIKFYKMMQMEKYLAGLKKANPYHSINLTYENQIVCERTP